MSPLFTLLAAVSVALCALLIVAGGLIHTNLRRRKAVAAGGPDFPSRILDDMRPVEDLLVDFVRHTPGMTHLLAVLAALHSRVSFARLVHEIRIGSNGSADLKTAVNLVGPTLFILGLAGLIRITAGGFAITEVGREVLRRIDIASQPVGFALPAVTARQKTAPTAASQEVRKELARSRAVTEEMNNMEMQTAISW